jgi:hypothetical protein
MQIPAFVLDGQVKTRIVKDLTWRQKALHNIATDSEVTNQ